MLRFAMNVQQTEHKHAHVHNYLREGDMIFLMCFGETVAAEEWGVTPPSDPLMLKYRY